MEKIGSKNETKLLRVFSPQANFFLNKHRQNSLSLIFGYQRKWSFALHKKGNLIHRKVMNEIFKALKYIRRKLKSGFRVYAFGFIEKLFFSGDKEKYNFNDDDDYTWTLADVDVEIAPEKIYNIYPKEKLFYDFDTPQELFSLEEVEKTCLNCNFPLGPLKSNTPEYCPCCNNLLSSVNVSDEAIMRMLRENDQKDRELEKINANNYSHMVKMNVNQENPIFMKEYINTSSDDILNYREIKKELINLNEKVNCIRTKRDSKNKFYYFLDSVLITKKADKITFAFGIINFLNASIKNIKVTKAISSEFKDTFLLKANIGEVKVLEDKLVWKIFRLAKEDLAFLKFKCSISNSNKKMIKTGSVKINFELYASLTAKVSFSTNEIPKSKEMDVQATLKIENNGSAPLDQVIIQHKKFGDVFSAPNVKEVNLKWDGEEVEISKEDLSLNDGILTIELKNLKDTDRGRFQPRSLLVVTYPLHFIRHSRFESDIILLAKKSLQSQEIKFTPEVPIIEPINGPLYEEEELNVSQLKILRKMVKIILKLEKLTKKRFKKLTYIRANSNMGITIRDHKITGISLFSCGLKSLPPSIGDLKSIYILNLRDNELESLPPSLKSLESLEELNISENNFEKLPDWLENINTLKKLIIKKNPLDINLRSDSMNLFLSGLGKGSSELKILGDSPTELLLKKLQKNDVEIIF